MTAMEAFEEFVGCGGNVRKGNPRVLVGRETLPTNEVLVTVSEFSAIKNGLYIKRGVRVVGQNEWSGRRMWMEFGRIVVWL